MGKYGFCEKCGEGLIKKCALISEDGEAIIYHTCGRCKKEPDIYFSDDRMRKYSDLLTDLRRK